MKEAGAECPREVFQHSSLYHGVASLEHRGRDVVAFSAESLAPGWGAGSRELWTAAAALGGDMVGFQPPSLWSERTSDIGSLRSPYGRRA